MGVLLFATSVMSQCLRNSTYPSLLPSSSSPTHYELNLNLPDPNSITGPHLYNGTVVLTAYVSHLATSCIVLSAGPQLTVNTATYTVASSVGKLPLGNIYGNGAVATITHDRTNEMVVLGLMTATVDSLVALTLTFTAAVNQDSPTGLFLSPNSVPAPTPQPAADGLSSAKEALTQWRIKSNHRGRGQAGSESQLRAKLNTAALAGTPMMLATQFEESDARTAFPCFDEPAYKATWSMHVTLPTTTTLDVLFNTELTTRKTAASGGTTVYSFAQTKQVLPSYLIAFAVGHFDYLTRVSRGVRYRIVTPPGKAAWAALALNATVHAAEHFGDAYNFSYSRMNTKMDQISVGGIDMDAMENQGLLTYAPQMLLLNPDASTLPPAPLGNAGELIFKIDMALFIIM